MIQIDPSRTDLAEEFRAAPSGPYSPELRRLLHLLWGTPLPGRPVVVRIEGGKFAVGTLPERRGQPVPLEPGTYDDHDAATWEVFRRRWEIATGQPLEL